MNAWEPIETPPKNGQRVIFSWLNANGLRRTSIGFYAAPHTLSDVPETDEFDAYTEYDEAEDNYYLKEGWYEEGAEGEYFYPKTTPTHWQPLPESPK